MIEIILFFMLRAVMDTANELSKIRTIYESQHRYNEIKDK